MHDTAAQCDLKKHYFCKGSNPSDWNRAQLLRGEIQVCVCVCVFPQNWALGPWGGQFVIFCLFAVATFSSEMPIFIVQNTRGS